MVRTARKEGAATGCGPGVRSVDLAAPLLFLPYPTCRSHECVERAAGAGRARRQQSFNSSEIGRGARVARQREGRMNMTRDALKRGAFRKASYRPGAHLRAADKRPEGPAFKYLTFNS